MINLVIIEDEKGAQQHLLHMLSDIDADVNITAVLESVASAISYFAGNPNVDLILSDVQLPDGLSFEIFRNTGIKAPVIFITGFDQFTLYAFESNGIDYLLKPVTREELQKAFSKYKMLQNHFSSHQTSIKRLLGAVSGKKKSRLIVKKGIENISIRYEEIIMCYTENKIVYVVDKQERKYLTDKTLNELEEELDRDMFFRANRQYIINLNYVKSFRPYEKVKLLLDLNMNDKKHMVIISQVTAPQFRKWITEA